MTSMSRSVPGKREYAILIGLAAVFLSLTYYEGIHIQKFLALPWYVLLFYPFAVSRLGKAISSDVIFIWLQKIFCKVTPSGTGAGDEIDPTGSGFQWVFGNLIACPICAGTWSAEGLMLLAILSPGWASAIILVLGAIGIAEPLIRLNELIFWRGRCAREEVGKCERERNGR